MLVSFEFEAAESEHLFDIASSHAEPVRKQFPNIDPFSGPSRVKNLRVVTLQIQKVLHIPWT
jgi:hypothetical protein